MRRRLAGLAAAAVLALGLAPAAAATPTTPGGGTEIGVTVPEGVTTGADGRIADAELRWGLNRETSGGAFAGGCNFLSAGTAGDTGGSRVWAEADGLYSSREGAVSIEKATVKEPLQRRVRPAAEASPAPPPMTTWVWAL
ncbi:hypothetical protein C5C27_02785, partial [Rathayibacter sp. AY2B7]|uniref:hypothetical protein n=1 Tax=Rathayibacter sp. AY2B7 TaxID=2080571 RepID=UPI000D47985C